MKNFKKIFNFRFIIYLCLIIAFLFHLHYFLNSSLYGDEIVSIFEANSYPLNHFFTKLIEITNPNGYFILLKVVLKFVDQVIYIKFFNLLFILTNILILFKIGSLFNFNFEQKLLFIFPFSISLYFLRFGYMLRMYGAGIFLFICSLYLFLYFIRTGREKHLFISYLIDVIGLLFVYGYVIWIVIKLLLLIFFKAFALQKFNLSAIIFPIIILTLFTLFLFSIFLNDMGGIPLFLNWVKIPEFYDFGLSFLSLSGFDYFNYFEKIGLITNDIEIFGSMISFLLIAIIIKFLRSIKIEIQAFRKNKEIIFHYMFIFSIIILFFAYLINFLGSFHFFHIRQMFVLASIISIYWGYALAMQKNKSDIFLYIFIILLITSSNYKNIFYPKFDFPQRNHDEIVIISPHLLEVGYYECEATSYNALIKLCPLKNILFDIKKTELLDQDEEFLLHSEVYLNHKNLNIKCIKVPGDFYKCSNLSK